MAKKQKKIVLDEYENEIFCMGEILSNACNL